MRVVVTGAAGFIGSHLVDALARAGHDVVAVDVAGMPRAPASPHPAGVPGALANPHPAGMPGAVANPHPAGVPGAVASPRRAGAGEWAVCDLAVDDLGALADADVVLHLAGRPGVRSSWGPGAADAHRDNVVATRRLLEACASTRPRFVLASSSSVYGDATRPCTEDDPVDPRSPYARSKAEAEQLVAAAGNTVILRYFSVYGPRQRPDMAFHRFIEAALDGTPAPLYGDGGQSRSFTYVGDVVDATIRAATTALPDGTIINVGNPESTTLRDALDRITTLTGTAPPTVAKDPAPGDVHRTWAGTARATALLGWTAGTGLDEGLRRQVTWHRQRRSGAPARPRSGAPARPRSGAPA
ncbi:NAD-dependent epimerase/dehydratase family protein [Actinoplanes couchii]|uniref:NAD-dependent epimerase/dehydratase domain-containing protein n=1 Tax=Actinoplanes couchii TaxID=403638 RepID=A0ABQ3XKI3_9ACTN|nr:NAD-dependent epimerase/dehydratase family protein [Actinoplanes couchii]MDR6320590.1 nucleoside-diphosphate-sugar epimerase [Actinoplanes couchii]GID58993.1 hypothetical protein Aco03nite_073970 [Actinoplanes couchii]